MTDHGRNRAARAAAALAAMLMAAGTAATAALADPDQRSERGRSAQAHDNGDGRANANANGHAHQDGRGQEHPGAGHGTPPAHAGGPAAESPTPGNARHEHRPARPARSALPPAAARTAPPARTERPGRPQHPARARRPAAPRREPRPRPLPNPRPAPADAKAGKTTICHATGSATNPYVTITISDNALAAHSRHHDGRDIIPAPAGGCPGLPAAAPAARPAAAGRHAVAGHGAVAAAAVRSALPTLTGDLRAAPRSGVLGTHASSPSTLPALSETLGEAARSSSPQRRRESGIRVASAARLDGGRLPFTGLETVLVALAGLLLLVAGTFIRRATQAPL